MNVGIDLGTTYSAIAICEEHAGRPAVEEILLPAANNDWQIPSTVYYPLSGDPIVGPAALNMLLTDPARVFQWFKRDLGDEKAAEDPRYCLDGRRLSPEELSADVLRVLMQGAQTYLGEPISGAVIGVPAWFGDRQREATQRAAEIAGLPLLQLIAEPSAAALAASVERPDDLVNKDVLVYDLGGGTFDVVLIRTRPGENGLLEVETLCRDGHFQLGGHDWDLALAEHLCARCSEDHHHNPKTSEDRREWPSTLEKIDRDKRYFSQGRESVSFAVGLRGHAVELGLEEFNRITDPLLQRTATWVEKVLKEGEERHGVKREELVVLLCGGATHLPGVRPLLTRLVGHEPLTLRRMSPEKMVVRGAAYAAFLKTSVRDRYRAVGVEMWDEKRDRFVNCVVLPEGAAANDRKNQALAIYEDAQTEITVVVLQGTDEDAEKCETIGEVTVSGLPPGRKAGAQVKITMWYDDNGILHAEVLDESGAKGEAAVTITR